MVDIKTLFENYRALLQENKALKEDNLSLKVQLGLIEPLEDQVRSDAGPKMVSPAPRIPVNATADPVRRTRSIFSCPCSKDAMTCMRKDGRAGTGGPDIRLSAGMIGREDIKINKSACATDLTNCDLYAEV